MSRITVSMKPAEEILEDRELGIGGRVQKEFDAEVIRRCERFTPKKEGKLIQSVWHGTTPGTGEVIWQSPYAHKQYTKGRDPGQSQMGKDRGKEWFKRMVIDEKESLLVFVKQRSGGR